MRWCSRTSSASVRSCWRASSPSERSYCRVNSASAFSCCRVACASAACVLSWAALRMRDASRRMSRGTSTTTAPAPMSTAIWSVSGDMNHDWSGLPPEPARPRPAGRHPGPEIKRSVELSPDALREAVADVDACDAAVLLGEAHDFADRAAAARRHEAEASVADRLEVRDVVEVLRPRIDNRQTVVEQNDFGLAPARAAIASREPCPRRIPRDLLGFFRAGADDRVADGVDELRGDVERIGVVRVGEHDDADLGLEVEERLGRVTR